MGIRTATKSNTVLNLEKNKFPYRGQKILQFSTHHEIIFEALLSYT